MAEKELEKLKKLSPEERIARLKELQEKDKTEIAKAQHMIRESEEQLAIEEEVKDIPIPQVKAVDIDQLFSAAEKELFKAKRFVEERRPVEETEEAARREEISLEDVTARGPERLPEEIAEEQRQYHVRAEQMAQRPADELYNRMRGIYQEVRETGALTPEQMRDVRGIQYAQIEKMDDIRAGGYLPSQRAAREMVLTQRMAHWLKDRYKA